MIITNQIRNSIVSQLYKIMRITTKYDYIPDDRLKKQLLIKEKTCLDNSLTIHEYLEKINFIIYSINKDTGMNTAPIRYEDLAPSLPKPNTFPNNPTFPNTRMNSPISPNNPNTYTQHNYNTFQPRNYTPNPLTKKKEESERRSTNTGVKSAFNQVYDIYTLTQSQETLKPPPIQHNTSSKQIKNNLVSNTHNMHNMHRQNPPIPTGPNDTNEKDSLPKKRAGLQEAKDAVTELLNTSIETNGVREHNQTKQKVNNNNFQKLIDAYSIDQFLSEIKNTDILPAGINEINSFNKKILELSYKIRLLLIKAGNPRDFSDYKKIRNIFEYQIDNSNKIFIDNYFLKEAEEYIHELSNKSRRALIKEHSSLNLEETYDKFIENMLN